MNLEIAERCARFIFVVGLVLILFQKWELADQRKVKVDALAVQLMRAEILTMEYPATAPIRLWWKDADAELKRLGFSGYAGPEDRWKVNLNKKGESE